MSEENKDLGDKAEEAAKEVKNDIKETFSSDNPDSGKTIAIIAHVTIIGYIIALIMHNNNKTEIGSFYLRQLLGLWIAVIVLGIIPVVGCFAAPLGLVFVILSLIGAIKEEMKPVAGVGGMFQDWFKNIF
jgi:hypothetical protein